MRWLTEVAWIAVNLLVLWAVYCVAAVVGWEARYKAEEVWRRIR